MNRLRSLLRTLQARFLLALALIGIVPLAVVGLSQARLHYRVNEQRAQRELSTVARVLASEFGANLNGLLDDVEAIAALPDIVEMKPDRQAQTLSKLFLSYNQFDYLAVVDGARKVVSSSHPARPLLMDAAAFDTAFKRGHQAWALVDKETTRQRILVIHHPIRNAERAVVGVLIGNVDLAYLANLLGGVQASGAGEAYVLDSTGRVLLHREQTIMEHERRDYSWLDILINGMAVGSGTTTYIIDSQAMVAGYAAVPDFGWTVLIERSLAEVVAPATQTVRLTLLALALTTLLSLALAYFLANALTRPVRDLAGAAKALATGDASAPLPVLASNDGELGTLVSSFEQMRVTVTEREAALRRSEETLAQRVVERTAELKIANDELAQALRLKDSFLATMSHELRTPLNAVLGMSEILTEQFYGTLNERQLEAVGAITQAGEQLLSMITDILDFTNMEAGVFKLEMRPVNVEEICHISLAAVSSAAEEKQISVSLTLDSQVDVIMADDRRIKQVLVNLLENAVKFTARAGSVGLDVHRDPAADAAVFTVWDTGIGIQPEDIQRLFTPFAQMDSKLSRRYEGTGLGLALVDRIVRKHGGRITVTSVPSVGSRFSVILPLRTA